ncbi:MAG: GTPase Era [Deinococcota bacterium]|jgi:GTP-binding protein Era|nr:GTPase Era [Deinococcota bacterium]
MSEPSGLPEPSQPSETTYSGFIAILGKPNVGKSTLLNTLLGVKVAPISPKPQTTRQGVRGIYSQDNRQLVFVDTPGLHKAKDALGEIMNREVREAVIDVNAILWVVDLRKPPGDEDRSVARLLEGLGEGAPIYLIGNKVDAAKYPEEALALYKELLPEIKEVRSLSALNDPKRVYDLRDELFTLLPESPFFFPANIRSDQPREVWAGELIRESAMIHLRQELPYSVAVKVLDWDDPREKEESSEEPIYIQAEIWVERMNHRGMVLGKGGKMIKEIGRTARKQLEVFLSTRIYLDLEVVVRRDWREDTESLRELGFNR